LYGQNPNQKQEAKMANETTPKTTEYQQTIRVGYRSYLRSVTNISSHEENGDQIFVGIAKIGDQEYEVTRWPVPNAPWVFEWVAKLS
jgi:hypothetical protein